MIIDPSKASERRLLAMVCGAEWVATLSDAEVVKHSQTARDNVIRLAKKRAAARETAGTRHGPWKPPH